MPRDTARSAPPAASERAQASARAARLHALVLTALGVALAWLVIGCFGLLWTIAFTVDARSMTIGLTVWVFCFVVPSTLATIIVYRVEEWATSLAERSRVPRARREPVPAVD